MPFGEVGREEYLRSFKEMEDRITDFSRDIAYHHVGWYSVQELALKSMLMLMTVHRSIDCAKHALSGAAEGMRGTRHSADIYRVSTGLCDLKSALSGVDLNCLFDAAKMGVPESEHGDLIALLRRVAENSSLRAENRNAIHTEPLLPGVSRTRDGK